MYAYSYFTCKCNSKHFQIPRQSICEWTVVFGPFLRSMPVSLGSWPIQHLTLRNFFFGKTFKKPVELFFPIQKGVFYIFFLKKWQTNAVSYLCYSAEQSMHQKDTHGIWVFVELQTSQLYVSCSAGSSDVQPFCSFLPRKTTHKATRKQKDSSVTSRRQLNGYKLREKSRSLPKSDRVLSPSSLSCWYLFFVYQVVSPYSCVCVWFHATFDSSPCFPLKDPTAPLGLSNSTRSFSPDSMLPGSCPEPPWFHADKVPSKLRKGHPGCLGGGMFEYKYIWWFFSTNTSAGLRLYV